MKIEIEPTRGTEVSDFTNGAHECFCDKQYKDANKFATCGDCPRDYIAGAWDARRKYLEMTDCQTTHAADCWGWGPRHYECAVGQVERDEALLRQALEVLEALEQGAWDTLRGRNAAAAIRERLGERAEP